MLFKVIHYSDNIASVFGPKIGLNKGPVIIYRRGGERRIFGGDHIVF